MARRPRQSFSDRCRGAMPTRESLETNRMMRPVAHLLLQPALWRFTRRSVPRAVGLGLWAGILIMIPFVQPVAAALLAIPIRANVPLTFAITLLTNPVTTPLIVVAALWLGSKLFGLQADPGSVMAMLRDHASIEQWGDWLVSSAAPALLSGLLTLATICGLVGYVVSAWVWRAWIGRKWARRERAIERGERA